MRGQERWCERESTQDDEGQRPPSLPPQSCAPNTPICTLYLCIFFANRLLPGGIGGGITTTTDDDSDDDDDRGRQLAAQSYAAMRAS